MHAAVPKNQSGLIQSTNLLIPIGSLLQTAHMNIWMHNIYMRSTLHLNQTALVSELVSVNQSQSGY